MSSLVNILEGVALLVAGAGLSFLLVWRKDRNLKRARTLEAEALIGKARNEAEIIIRDARLAANEEALKLREQIEKSFTARRAERAELEARLSAREALINSQLQRVVDTEKSLAEQEGRLRENSSVIEARLRELTELTRQTSERLEKLAGVTEAEAKAEFLKII